MGLPEAKVQWKKSGMAYALYVGVNGLAQGAPDTNGEAGEYRF